LSPHLAQPTGGRARSTGWRARCDGSRCWGSSSWGGGAPRRRD